ncbi:HAD family hydrolase [Leptospira sp. 96542]|nr:HAD family hydrolase [Leptospira sp. 96542]
MDLPTKTVGVFPLRSWVPEIHSQLKSIIEGNSGLACFDFDNTLIRNDFGEKIMEEIMLDGLPNLPKDLSQFFRNSEIWRDHTKLSFVEKQNLIWEEYSYNLKEFGIEAGYRWSCFLFQGLSPEDYERISAKVWKRVNIPDESIGVTPQKEMLDLVYFLQKNNWRIYIVTASPEPGIAAIASHFSIKKENVIGMRQTIGLDGKYTASLIEPYTYGEGKVKAIEKWIGEYPDLAFGDSFNDFPMLCTAKKMGVAIDKGNPEFVEACSKQGIYIQPYFNFNI